MSISHNYRTLQLNSSYRNKLKYFINANTFIYLFFYYLYSVFIMLKCYDLSKNEPL